jgi:RNA polymerase sigma-70 factor (ECF subfamily)
MDDNEIVDLFWARDEAAIVQAERKYGGYCGSIARNILHSEEDAEECLSDVWLAAWNSIPPNRPRNLPAFLAKIVRGKAIDRWRAEHAGMRRGDRVETTLEELTDWADSSGGPEEELMSRELERGINAFLGGLPAEERNVFLCRYWYFDDIAWISRSFGFSKSKVKSMLHRTRKKLRLHLQKEGFL